MTVLKTTTIVICKNTNFNKVLSEAYIEINQPIFFYNQGIYKNRVENDRFFMKLLLFYITVPAPNTKAGGLKKIKEQEF